METNGTQRAILACSLFLYTGHIGAATVAAGLIQIFAGATSGLGLVVFGGILATASWCRAWTSVAARNRASVVKAHLRCRIGERHLMAAYARRRSQLPFDRIVSRGHHERAHI